MAEENRQVFLNHQLKDSSSKLIFGDNILCSQFLRHYADMDILRNIKPEDLEDVSERYVPFFGEERACDTVKKVNIGKYFSLKKSENPLGLQLYFVSLIEHKTKVEYNVSMQVLRYTIYIWEDYEREMGRLFEDVTFDFQAARKEFEEKAAKAEADAKARVEVAEKETEIVVHIAKMLSSRYSEAEIIKSLQEKFSLSADEADKKYKKVIE